MSTGFSSVYDDAVLSESELPECQNSVTCDVFHILQFSVFVIHFKHSFFTVALG